MMLLIALAITVVLVASRGARPDRKSSWISLEDR